MSGFRGVIVEESLENPDVLRDVKIISTQVLPIAESDNMGWLVQRTIHEIHVPVARAKEVAQNISHAIDSDHGNFWCIDFKDKSHHYIIFKDKVFCVDRSSRDQYEAACMYGRSIGIPATRIHFCPGGA